MPAGLTVSAKRINGLILRTENLQEFCSYYKGENADLQIKGRHDPAIVHRARIVQDAATAIVLCDMLSLRFGTDWLNGCE